MTPNALKIINIGTSLLIFGIINLIAFSSIFSRCESILFKTAHLVILAGCNLFSGADLISLIYLNLSSPFNLLI